MNETKYYQKIKNIVEKIEINTKVRYLQDNSEKIIGYWNIGKLLVEAQNGEARAKYGDNYSYTNLSRFRQFYCYFPKLAAVRQLSWTHIKILLARKNENERNYYINQIIINNLSSRDLTSLIKSKAFERLSYADKQNIKLIENDNYNLTIEDMIKDPILIESNHNSENLSEKVLHKYIITMLEKKFLELGTGFAILGHEYKIHINGYTYKIDLLFFNVELKCYIVVEIKTRNIHPKDIGQLEFYVNYIEKNINNGNYHKTIGLLVVKKNNKYIIEYTTNSDIYITTYKLIKKST